MNEYQRQCAEAWKRHRNYPVWFPYIRQFSDHWRLNPNGYVIYLRVSDRSQRYKGTLDGQFRYMRDATRKVAGLGKWKAIHHDVEVGTLSAERPGFWRAIRFCRERQLILVACDVSRFIRSGSYDHLTNRDIEPTSDEYGRSHEIAYGVQLCTVASPALTEPERLSFAIKTSDCGRPKKHSAWTELGILRDLGVQSNGRWAMSRRNAAKKHGVSKSFVEHLLERRNSDDPETPQWRDVCVTSHSTEWAS